MCGNIVSVNFLNLMCCSSEFMVNFERNIEVLGYAVAQLVEALYYKPEGGRFDSRWSNWNFSVT
jgi:hypothetical protein